VGAALGVAGGLEAGMAVASILIPGVGPVLALGLIGAAIFGAGGAAAGALAGNSLEKGIAEGLPRDELFFYEDALRRGRSVVLAFADNEQTAERARAVLQRSGAESVDAAREDWWIGLRDAEREHYTNQGGNFNLDEAKYRLGFESALHPDCRGKSCEDVSAWLKSKHGDDSTAPAFRQGFDRGQDYLSQVKATRRDEQARAERSRIAATDRADIRGTSAAAAEAATTAERLARPSTVEPAHAAGSLAAGGVGRRPADFHVENFPRRDGE